MQRNTYRCTQETREKLLSAIVELVHEKSYRNVTVRDICRRAGVSSGSFYHHYGSKEALVREAYLQIDRLVTPEVLEMCERLPPLNALRKLMELQIRFVAEEVGMVMVEYYRVLIDGVSVSALNPDRPYYQAITHHVQRCMDAGIIRTNEPAEYLTEFCLHFLRGLIFDWVLRGCSYPLEARFRRDFRLLAAGLTAQADSIEE